jgi:hypothetical protein
MITGLQELVQALLAASLDRWRGESLEQALVWVWQQLAWPPMLHVQVLERPQVFVSAWRRALLRLPQVLLWLVQLVPALPSLVSQQQPLPQEREMQLQHLQPLALQ